MIPWAVAHQAPLTMGFSRQEHWSRLPLPTPGDLPNPEIEPNSTGRFFTTEVPGKPLLGISTFKFYSIQFSQFSSFIPVQFFVTPWTVACQASLSITNCQSLPKPMSMSQWCHPAMSSSVVPFSSCLQYFPASGSFQVSQLFASGDQIIGVSASTSVLPMNGQDWFPLGWTGWISLLSKTLGSQESSPALRFKSINSSSFSFLYSPTLTSIHDYWKNHNLGPRRTFPGKVTSLLFSMLSRLVITFLPRSKHLSISLLKQNASECITQCPMNCDAFQSGGGAVLAPSLLSSKHFWLFPWLWVFSSRVWHRYLRGLPGVRPHAWEGPCSLFVCVALSPLVPCPVICLSVSLDFQLCLFNFRNPLESTVPPPCTISQQAGTITGLTSIFFF